MLGDVKFALRILAKSPGATAASVAALAVGIGANITVFGFINGLVLRPLDVPERSSVVRMNTGGPGLMRTLYWNDYEAYRDRSQSFEGLAMSTGGGPRAVRIGSTTDMVVVTPVTGNYFELLRVRARRGRLITPADDEPGAPDVVVVSSEGLRRFFDGDESVVGETIFINKKPFTVVGITPESFKGTVYPTVPQFYSTWRLTREIAADPGGYYIGRLKPGVSLGEAQADLDRVAAQLTEETGTTKTIGVYPGTASRPHLVEYFGGIAVLVFTLVGAVLWMACSNIALLLLARATARRREIAVRRALGASLPALLRQLLIENAVVAALGGAAALFLAHAVSQWLSQLYFPVPMPIALVYTLDWRVAGFAIAASLAACLLFGLGPALTALRTDVAPALGTGDHGSPLGRSQTSRSLVITQVATSMALLSLCGLMIRSVTLPFDPGFETKNVVTTTVGLMGSDYPPEVRNRFLERVLDGLRETPGIRSASAVHRVPLTVSQGVPVPESIRAAGNDAAPIDGPAPQVYTNRVTPDYFETLSIPLLQGRDFSRNDALGSTPVAIVNEALARRFWPGEDAIGRELVHQNGSRFEVVGIAANSKYGNVDEEQLAFVYLPMAQEPVMTLELLIRSELSVAATVNAAREHITSVDPDVVAYKIATLEDRLRPHANIAIAWVAGALGALGVALSSFATFALVSWIVRERRRETGIRIALGASERSIVGSQTAQAVRWALAGISIGLALFLGGASFLTSLLRGVSPLDPVVVAGAALVLLLTTYVASRTPAIRATRVSPIDVLRD